MGNVRNAFRKVNVKVVPYRPVNLERKEREEDGEQGFSSDSDVCVGVWRLNSSHSYGSVLILSTVTAASAVSFTPERILKIRKEYLKYNPRSFSTFTFSTEERNSIYKT